MDAHAVLLGALLPFALVGGGLVLTRSRSLMHSHRRAAEESLEGPAFRDPLTNLANRARFHDLVDRALSDAGDEPGLGGVGVILIELANLRSVNARHGHAVGDEMLVGCAHRLAAVVPSDVRLARIGGDMFAALVGFGGHERTERLAAEMLSALRPPIDIGVGRTGILCRGGAAVTEGHRHAIADELIRRAAAAVRSAGAGSARVEVVDPAIPAADVDGAGVVAWYDQGDHDRERILAVLRGRDEIRPAMQPIVDLRLGRVVGYEALARFSDGRSPNLWFDSARAVGLGEELELAAAAAALRAGAERPDGTYLSVNVSPSVMVSREFAELFGERLDGIMIEVTENELVVGGKSVEAAIRDFSGRGALIAIDDAGAGYAGLRQLTALRPDVIKLDRGLIEGIHADDAKAALVDAFVRFARRVRADVCAEGIELVEELESLADLDVAYGQGFLLGRPNSRWGGVSEHGVDAIRRSTRRALTVDGVPGSRDAPSDAALERAAAKIADVTDASDLVEVLRSIGAGLGASAVALCGVLPDRLALVSIAMARVAGEADRSPSGLAGRDYEPGTFPLEEYTLSAQALGSGEAVQLFDDDPDAPAAEVADLIRCGYRCSLMVPVIAGGASVALLELYRPEHRPWSRFELARARLLSHLLGMQLSILGGVTPARAESAIPGDA